MRGVKVAVAEVNFDTNATEGEMSKDQLLKWALILTLQKQLLKWLKWDGTVAVAEKARNCGQPQREPIPVNNLQKRLDSKINLIHF